tara:strand:+ start:276 stop:1154 length:879 start_codon:yes stop_codon:yes gene_type:complete
MSEDRNNSDKKIVYVKYFADDMLQGCALLTWQAELVYRRICDHIYTSENKLFDDMTTWKVLTFKFEKEIGNMSVQIDKEGKKTVWSIDVGINMIKEELLAKRKIFIVDGIIRNKGCDKWLEEAKTFYKAKSNAGKKGAKTRWDSTAIVLPLATNSQQPTANSHKNNNIFEEFWKIVRYKKGKEDARKSFNKIDFSKEEYNHLELAEQYNQYLDNLPEWQTPKYVQGWLTGKRWNDEESLTPTEFAKKYHIEGTFIKFENDLYYFREKDSFGMVDYKYNKNGKLVSDGKKQKG